MSGPAPTRAAWWHASRRRVLWLLGLLAVHELLGRGLVSSQAVAVLLAAGPQTPLHLAALAVGFVVVRVLTVLALPGLLAYAVLAGAIDWRAARRGAGPSS